MIELPKEVKYQGFNHIQLKRQDNIAIYQKCLGNILVGYETIIIQARYPQETYFRHTGNNPELKEHYPQTSAWGRYGFTYKHLKDAERKFDELLEKSSKKSKETAIKSAI